MSNTQVGQLGRLAIRLFCRGAPLLFRTEHRDVFWWMGLKEQEGPKTETHAVRRKPFPLIFDRPAAARIWAQRNVPLNY
jgi:hypothetical protein